MKLWKGVFLVSVFLFVGRLSVANPGNLLIAIPELSEKQIDSVAVWFHPAHNIIESGICLENKLLLIRLQEKSAISVEDVFNTLKKHGIDNFFLKEDALLDQIISSCSTFIYFP